MFRRGSREASQSHCALDFVVHRCNKYLLHMIFEAKNPVAYVTS